MDTFKDALGSVMDGCLKADFHMHTVYCDGADTPEEMILSAIEKGLDAVGISSHSYTFFDESYCIKKDEVARYIAEISSLKEKYKERIQVFCGVEQDIFSQYPTDGFDYVIGSVHYLKLEDRYIPVDETEEILADAADRFFKGDIYALCERYFETVSLVAEKTGCDIIGHFDLITKFQERHPLFDERHSRYRVAWKKAADILLPYDVPFEINFGAISRGLRTSPYPSEEIVQYLRDNGARLILSSDSHRKEDVLSIINP